MRERTPHLVTGEGRKPRTQGSAPRCTKNTPRNRSYSYAHTYRPVRQCVRGVTGCNFSDWQNFPFICGPFDHITCYHFLGTIRHEKQKL